MEPLVVRICAGTACYVLGGSELTELARSLPAVWKGRIRVEGTVCLEYCRRAPGMRPPFVLVGDRVVGEASPEKVTALVRELLG